LSEANPPFEILRFDIRYSAVRCSASGNLIRNPICMMKFHTNVQGTLLRLPFLTPDTCLRSRLKRSVSGETKFAEQNYAYFALNPSTIGAGSDMDTPLP